MAHPQLGLPLPPLRRTFAPQNQQAERKRREWPSPRDQELLRGKINRRISKSFNLATGFHVSSSHIVLRKLAQASKVDEINPLRQVFDGCGRKIKPLLDPI
jgi:hypothetical protein